MFNLIHKPTKLNINRSFLLLRSIHFLLPRFSRFLLSFPHRFRLCGYKSSEVWVGQNLRCSNSPIRVVSQHFLHQLDRFIGGIWYYLRQRHIFEIWEGKSDLGSKSETLRPSTGLRCPQNPANLINLVHLRVPWEERL